MLLFLAGLLGASLCRGAYPLLTTMPSSVGWSTVVALCAVGATARRHRVLQRAVLATLGVGMAWLLPLSPVPPPGGVRTAFVGHGFSGDLFSALERIDADPGRVVGTIVTVSGEWMPASSATRATVSRTIMACCAADSVAVGFDVDALHAPALPPHSEVTVRGVLGERMENGEVRYALQRASVRRHAGRSGD